jgi:hypothetical protein
MVTRAVVSVEPSTAVAVDSTVAVAMAADADNKLVVSEMNPAGCQRGQPLLVATNVVLVSSPRTPGRCSAFSALQGLFLPWLNQKAGFPADVRNRQKAPVRRPPPTFVGC